MEKKVNKKILIVEDDPDYREIIQTGFSSEPLFTIVLAKDGEEGFEVAVKEKPDLIVMDVLMPKIDGVEAAKKIREQGIASPIIFLTNVSDPGGIDRAFSVLNSRYIVKASMHVGEVVKAAKDLLAVS